MTDTTTEEAVPTMKVNVNHTLELTEHQLTINGDRLLGKDMRPLLIQALDDLAEGKRVALADYGRREKLEALFEDPETRQMAKEMLWKALPGSEGGTVHLLAKGWKAVAPETMRSIGEAMAGSIPETGSSADDEAAADAADELIESGLLGGKEPVDVELRCLRCDSDMEDDAGMCERCMEPLDVECRKDELAEHVEENGIPPAELRPHLGEDGKATAGPYMCNRCLVERRKEIAADKLAEEVENIQVVDGDGRES